MIDRGVVFQAGDFNYHRFFNITSEHNKAYAKTLDADYYLFKDNNFSKRHMSWFKVYKLLYLLQKGYKWVLMLDGDAVVTNQEKDIIKYVKLDDTIFDIFVCSDGVDSMPWNFNCGVMLLRNSNIVKKFITNIINCNNKLHYFERNWEQNAAHDEVKFNPGAYKNKIKIYNKNLFNHNSEWIFHPCFYQNITDDEKEKYLNIKIKNPKQHLF